MPTEGLLTTTEVARLAGCSPDIVRTDIRRGRLTVIRRTELGRPLLDADEVRLWKQRRRTRPTSAKRAEPWRQTYASLCEFGSANAAELAEILALHPGNVRKHLALMAARGLAERGPDGQWVPTSSNHSTGAA